MQPSRKLQLCENDLTYLLKKVATEWMNSSYPFVTEWGGSDPEKAGQEAAALGLSSLPGAAEEGSLARWLTAYCIPRRALSRPEGKLG